MTTDAALAATRPVGNCVTSNAHAIPKLPPIPDSHPLLSVFIGGLSSIGISSLADGRAKAAAGDRQTPIHGRAGRQESPAYEDHGQQNHIHCQ